VLINNKLQKNIIKIVVRTAVKIILIFKKDAILNKF